MAFPIGDDLRAAENPDNPIRNKTEMRLSYCCGGCGLLYEEARAVISPHFALCPRCGRFNEPAYERREQSHG